jgi:FkbM family methyltransferase
VSEQEAAFELSMAGLRGPIRFAFGSGGERDTIAALVRANGLASYEAPTPAVFARLVAGEAEGVVLDIGANTGIYSLLAAAASPTARVCAFEPVEEVRELLLANLALNPELTPRIAVEGRAVSSVCGTLPFFETINDRGFVSTSSTLELGHAMRVGNHVRQDIATETLDGWASANGVGPIRLVKMDVEGHEHAVLEGGRRVMDRHRPFIIAEMLGAADFSALNRISQEDGYRDFVLAPGAVRECATLRFHPDAWNHLLCPVEKIGRIGLLCEQLDFPLESG